jgi:hypothetical protein
MVVFMVRDKIFVVQVQLQYLVTGTLIRMAKDENVYEI